MSTPLRLEARVAAQERGQIALAARIEEVAADVTRIEAEKTREISLVME